MPGPAWLPPQPWADFTAPLTSGSVSRSAELLERVLDQFEVEHATRYQPTTSQTWCNIYVWDGTKALGCEIPHFVNGGVGENGCKRLHASEQRANDLPRYLDGDKGKRNGWAPCSEEEAARRVALGFPVVGVWVNLKGSGHTVMCRGPKPGDPPGLYASGAGRVPTAYGPIAEMLPAPRQFWTHD